MSGSKVQVTPRKRKASQRDTDQALSTLMEHTDSADLSYIIDELKGSLAPFVNILASWVRDKKLHRALTRHRNEASPSWAATCKHVKQLGTQKCIEVIKRANINFFDQMPFMDADLCVEDEKFDEVERLHKALVCSENLVKIVCFLLGCYPEAWLPSTDVQASLNVFDVAIASLGNRLQRKKARRLQLARRCIFPSSS